MNAYVEYVELMKKLVHVRWLNQGHDSAEEDEILDAMDPLWWKLTEEERGRVNNDPLHESLLTPVPQLEEHLVESTAEEIAAGAPPRNLVKRMEEANGL